MVSPTSAPGSETATTTPLRCSVALSPAVADDRPMSNARIAANPTDALTRKDLMFGSSFTESDRCLCRIYGIRYDQQVKWFGTVRTPHYLLLTLDPHGRGIDQETDCPANRAD